MPVYGSELERKAAAVRAAYAAEEAKQERFRAQQNAERDVFKLAISIACPTHQAAPRQAVLATDRRRRAPPVEQGRLPDMINASHIDVQIAEEVNASQAARWRQLDAAEAKRKAASKSISPNRPGTPQPPAPKKPKVPRPLTEPAQPKKSTTPAPKTTKPASASAQPPSSSMKKPSGSAELPPGSMVLTPAEAEAVDHLLARIRKLATT